MIWPFYVEYLRCIIKNFVKINIFGGSKWMIGNQGNKVPWDGQTIKIVIHERLHFLDEKVTKNI